MTDTPAKRGPGGAKPPIVPVDQFLTAWAEGATSPEVAALLGVSVAYVYSRARTLRVKGYALPKKPRGPQAKTNAQHVADLRERIPTGVLRLIGHVPDTQVAERCHVTKEAVRKWRRLLGLPSWRSGVRDRKMAAYVAARLAEAPRAPRGKPKKPAAARRGTA